MAEHQANIGQWLAVINQGNPWLPIRDGDSIARQLYHRHYSCYQYADGRDPKFFVGPGEKLVLTTIDRLALFIWRKFIPMDGQTGVNCAYLFPGWLSAGCRGPLADS